MKRKIAACLVPRPPSCIILCIHMLDYIAHGVVAKKIVSQLGFSMSYFFARTWNKIFVPNLLQLLESRITKLRVYQIVAAVLRKRAR